jgi:MFS family permease
MVLCVRPPLLVRRPVLGPLLGGFLTSAFGWRSTFAALAAAAAVLGALIAVAFPETQQCMALRRFAAQHGDAAMNRIEEAPEILAAPPALQPFWQPMGCVLWDVMPICCLMMRQNCRSRGMLQHAGRGWGSASLE